MLRTIFFLFFCFLASCNTLQTHLTPSEKLLQKATEWLWSQQQSDGGWHSKAHGIMKGGQSLTAFILWHLLESKHLSSQNFIIKKRKALDFLRKHISPKGILGVSDPDIIDYPNYSTAYALRIFAKYGEVGDSLLVKRMTQYLLNQQFTEQRGIHPMHLAYGAWGFGETNLTNGETGHVDLSHTRRILESLRIAGVTDTLVFKKARKFLHLLQKNPIDERTQSGLFDGGFYASSVTESTNKSTIDSLDFYPSYATATADGLLALLAAGYQKEDKLVQMAYQWLQNHSNLEEPAGIPKDNHYEWHKVLFFYHLAVRAEALSHFKNTPSWKKKLTSTLISKQHIDGSFMNPSGSLNKEDDPLLATTLAIITLNH